MAIRAVSWRWLMVLLACCGLAGMSLAAPALAKKHHRKSACQKLTGRDLAPSRSLKLVEKRIDSVETDLEGCALPKGPVHIFAIRLKGETTISDFTVQAVASRWALVSAHSDSQYASDARVWVFDIDGGRVLYTISRWSCMTGATDCLPAPPSVARGVLEPIGKAALAFSDGATTTIAGFGTNGARRNFDSGPLSDLPTGALNLNNGAATWLHSGVQRSAALP